jgi:hypothetical protein
MYTFYKKFFEIIYRLLGFKLISQFAYSNKATI